MAYLVQEDDKQLQPGQEAQGAQSGATPGAAAPLANAGGGLAGSGAVSTAGVGKGGVGGWTNIQAYLNANKGQDGSAKLLNQTVGDTFNQEKQNFQTQSNQAKTQAQGAVAQNKLGQDQASQMIQQAGAQYKYPTAVNPGATAQPQAVAAPVQNVDGSKPVAQQAQTQTFDRSYDDLIGDFQGRLSAQYQGPKDFAYGMGGKTQEYGQNLWNDQGFKGIMNELYNKSAGGSMGAGKLALQEQLDTNNENVMNARTGLLNQYSGLKSEVDSGVANTNQELKSAQDAFVKDQGDLKSFLGSQSDTNKGDLEKAMADYGAAESRIQNKEDTSRVGYDNTTEMNKLLGEDWGRSLAGSRDDVYDASVGDFYNYMKGEDATLENVQGVDESRSRYNAIMDALGIQDKKINRADKGPEHGKLGYDAYRKYEADNRG